MEKHQLPHIPRVSPVLESCPLTSVPAEDAAEPRELLSKLRRSPGLSPLPSSALLKPHTFLCFPPTAHPQHLLLLLQN